MRKVFTLFLAVFITALSSSSISAQTCGTATRTAQDCKAGTVDAVGWAMQQFFNDGSTATWNFESGAVFQENADGTANLTGVITQYGSSPKRSFNVVVNFTGKSTSTTGSPETNNLCPVIATNAWQYYTLSSGSLTGVVGTTCEGGKVSLSQHMMPSQYGIGAANQCSEQTNLGLTGWFQYQIVSQPSNNWLQILPYSLAPVIGQADICIRLSGLPTMCGGGGGNPCDNDVAPPVFANCPANIVKTLTVSGSCLTISWTAPTATDNCSTPTVTQTAGPANGSCLTPGSYTVTYTATDAKGNKAYCTFTIIVNPYVAPCTQPATPYGYTYIGQYGNNFYFKYNGENEKYSDGKKRSEGNGGHYPYCKESGEKEFLKNYAGNCPIWLGMSFDGNNWKCDDGGYMNYKNWGYGEENKNEKDKNYSKMYNDGYWYKSKDDDKGCEILVLPCAGTPPPPTVCNKPATPYGYTYLGQYGNNFYFKYNGENEKYSDGKKRSEGNGGHYPYCKEGGEKEFLKNYAGNCPIWLGMSFDGNNWKCDDGGNMNYKNWGYGEENKNEKDKNYSKMYNDGYWYKSKDDDKGCEILVLPCAGSIVNPPVCNANFDQNKYYKIVNKKSGKCLDVEGGKKDKYAAVEQYDYYGGDNQKWYIIPTSNGYCKMYAKHSDKILSCSNSWNGSQLYQDEDKKDKDKENSNGEKEWKIECDKDGYKITHRMSGRSCHEGYSIYNGSHCQLWDWNSGDEERYDLVDVTNEQQQGQHLQNTKVLSLSATVEANKTRIEWVNNTGASNDFFQVEKLNAATGNFEAIVNVPSLKTTVIESYVSYDVKPTEGDNFYRINAISLDGSNNVSGIQKVNFKGLAGNLSVFPNPADEILNIDLTSYKGKAVTLFVYNRLGQTVITQQIENVVDGITQVDISNQQVGNYLVRVVSKGKNDQTKSFILNK